MVHLMHLLVTEYHAGNINKSVALSFLRGEYAGMPKSWYVQYLHVMTRFHISPTGW
jgi:hypothetical protein